MLASSGEITEPCPVPISLTVTTHSSRTPAFNHLRMRRVMRLSPMRCSTNRASQSLLTESKKDATSASKMKFTRHGPLLVRISDYAGRALGALGATTPPLASAGVRASASRQQSRRIGTVRQRFDLELNRRAHPKCIVGMVVVLVVAQRMHQDVEPVAVQHQPRHDLLERFFLENDLDLRHRMRASDASILPDLHREACRQPVAERLGGGQGLILVVDVHVVAVQ